MDHASNTCPTGVPSKFFATLNRIAFLYVLLLFPHDQMAEQNEEKTSSFCS